MQKKKKKKKSSFGAEKKHLVNIILLTKSNKKVTRKCPHTTSVTVVWDVDGPMSWAKSLVSTLDAVALQVWVLDLIFQSVVSVQSTPYMLC